MTKDEAMKMALEALTEAENQNDTAEKWRRHLAAKDALRQALDQFPDTTKMMEPEELVCVCGAIWQGQEMICPPKCLEEGIEREMPTDRGTWDEFGNSGMQYPEECDLIGGETDCVEEPPNSTTDVVESTDSLSTLLWRDLKTDRQRADWLRLGMGYQTGVVASAIQQELAMAYERLVGFQKIHAALEQPEQTVSLEEYKRLQRLVTSQGIRLMEYESKQEPVAWMYVNKDGECEQIEFGDPFNDPSVTLLYTAPPKREWQGLTDNEFTAIARKYSLPTRVGLEYFKDELEAKLKEKNNV